MSSTLYQRQQPDAGSQLLDLLSDPFKSQLGTKAVASSLAFSLILAAAIALLFCFLRPYNNVVYAPRAKYADSKHAPPPVTKGLFGWVPPLIRTKEQDLVERVGLDAAVFMRVCRMLRNIFSIVAILGCAIAIPVNLHGTTRSKVTGVSTLSRLTPAFLYGWPTGFWGLVIVAYIMTITILFFLWTNYRQVARMRKEYFESSDYQRSLHARTLMVTDIPKELRSDEGIARVIDEVKATNDMPRTAIARNVKDLPDLVEEYEETVKELEEHLAKYLKNPDKLPSKRPTCKPHKSDKAYGTYPNGTKVDAIEYLTGRIKELELEINEVRNSVDKRNAMSYGFASYESIPIAHGVAYQGRHTAPQGTKIVLAPKPNDLIWKNLGLSKKERSRRNSVNRIWILILTIAWVIPNILIAVFLSNLQNLATLWPAFQQTLTQDETWWAFVQGVIAPAITTAFYFYLPAIFRKFCMKAGDTTKTSRERHVARSLYSFFCFNNLITFSLFSAVFSWIVTLAKDKTNILDSQPFAKMVNGLIAVSTYWLSWMLQRNLGAAVDLGQLFTLIWGSFSRRFLSPTPRRLIELSAPQPFDYAGYYNYFLFYATVAVTFATIQPLVLPVTALYFWLDSFMKKYLIMYVFITKYESGGMFWRSVFNRMCFIVIFGACVIALIIGGVGYIQNQDNTHIWIKMGCLIPIPIIVVGFKFYCKHTFDTEIHYYQKGQAIRDSEVAAGEEGKKKRKGDRVGQRFGHPVLYRPLITPMVASKSQHLLKTIYTGRTSVDDGPTIGGYSDVYMGNMDTQRPGKSVADNGTQGWEIVDENNMDFEHFKNRAEFRDQAGGDGELYGHAADMIRPGTPSSAVTGLTRAGTWESSGHWRNESGETSVPYNDRSRSESRDSERTRVNEGSGMDYPRGYHQTPSNLREASPAGSDFGAFGARQANLARQESRDGLMNTAAPPGHSTPYSNPAGGYGPVRYGNVPGETPGYDPNEENTSYDYFRRGRTGAR